MYDTIPLVGAQLKLRLHKDDYCTFMCVMCIVIDMYIMESGKTLLTWWLTALMWTRRKMITATIVKDQSNRLPDCWESSLITSIQYKLLSVGICNSFYFFQLVWKIDWKWNYTGCYSRAAASTVEHCAPCTGHSRGSWNNQLLFYMWASLIKVLNVIRENIGFKISWRRVLKWSCFSIQNGFLVCKKKKKREKKIG